MEPVVRALDVGFGHTKFVSSVDGSEVSRAHFPSVAYPTKSDETTDLMGGRRKTRMRWYNGDFWAFLQNCFNLTPCGQLLHRLCDPAGPHATVVTGSKH
jgi:hypothetical protein